MRIRFLLGSLTLLCLLPLASQIDHWPEIDELFAEWNDLDQPGCAVGVFKDGEIIYQQGYGAANLEHQIPITATSVFQIGSVSKQFTAACFLLLVEDGLVDLDAHLRDFYPDFPAYAAKITMRHLLYHTSGIRDYDQLVQYCPDCDFDSFYQEDVLDLIGRQKALNTPPGDEFIYTNSGYWLLGDIVEKISGQSLAEFAQQRLFGPLGMGQTLYADDYTSVIPQRAYGYEEDDESDIGYWWHNTTTSLVGDGGLFTSISDFKHWDNAFYSREVLSDKFWDLALRKGVLNNGDTLSYGAGIEHLNYKGWPIHKHTGNGFGFCAIFIRIPPLHLSVVVLSNRGEAYSIEEKGEAILDLLLEEQPSLAAEIASTPKICPVPSAEQALYGGHYWSGSSYLARQIYQQGDTLFYGPDPQRGYPIWPIGQNRFRADNGLELTFSGLAQGGFTMQTSRAGKLLSKYDPYQPVNQDQLALSTYTGRYYSDEIMAEYVFVREEEELIWYSEGEAVSRLVPIMMDMFRSEGGTNFKFLRDKDGRIMSLSMGNRRLRGLAFDKKDK